VTTIVRVLRELGAEETAYVGPAELQFALDCGGDGAKRAAVVDSSAFGNGRCNVEARGRKSVNMARVVSITTVL